MEAQINRKKLMEARYAKGMSMLRLAKEAGVSHLTISQVEKGLRVPAPSTIKKMCDVLGIEVADVLQIGESAS